MMMISALTFHFFSPFPFCFTTESLRIKPTKQPNQLSIYKTMMTLRKLQATIGVSLLLILGSHADPTVIASG